MAIQRTSITSDEVIHIPAGYYGLSTGEYRMNAEHPPLAKMWSALPLLLFLPHDSGPPELNGNFSQRGAHFYGHFWNLNREGFLRIWFWARTAMVALTVGLGLLIFVSARRWFGALAASVAVVLYALEPTVLGHGRVVHTDIPAALAYLLFFVALDRYRRAPSFLRAFGLGTATALALLTKFSMIVLLPVMAGAFVLIFRRQRDESYRWQRIAAHLIVITIVFIVLIQAGYGFRNPSLGPDAKWIQDTARYPGLVLRTIDTLSFIFPRDFLFGIYVVETHNNGGHSSSLLGQYDHRGWWYYFPVAFALKTPIPFLLLSVTAVLWALWQATQYQRPLGVALIPLGIYAALAMSSGINIGIRHFLPAYPFLFMLCGAFISSLYGRVPKAALAITAIVVGTMAVEASANFPHYISYMNQLKGRSPGWHYLSDSNVEWGDAVPDLVSYLRARNVNRVSGAMLGGNMTLHFYGIEFMDLYDNPAVPKTRFVALGASFLNGSTVEYGDLASGRGTEQERVNFFDAYRRRTPVAVFGNSIYLFEDVRP